CAASGLSRLALALRRDELEPDLSAETPPIAGARVEQRMDADLDADGRARDLERERLLVPVADERPPGREDPLLHRAAAIRVVADGADLDLGVPWRSGAVVRGARQRHLELPLLAGPEVRVRRPVGGPAVGGDLLLGVDEPPRAVLAVERHVAL